MIPHGVVEPPRDGTDSGFRRQQAIRMQLQRGDGRRHRPIVMAATGQDNRSPALPDICPGCSAQVALHGGSRQGVRISRSSSSARSPGAASLPCGRWRPRERPAGCLPGPVPTCRSSVRPYPRHRRSRMLRPSDTATRERKSLTGLWRFRLDATGEGRSAGWFRGPLPEAGEMAVPASYNDISVDATVRDHVGEVWYQTTVRVPRGWDGAARRAAFRVGDPPGHGVGGRRGGRLPRGRLHPVRGRRHRTRPARERGADHRRWWTTR